MFGVKLTRNAQTVYLAQFRLTRGFVTTNAFLGSSGTDWKQKSSWLSRCVRFVIARHSPERNLERGLPTKAPEKNRPNRSEAAWKAILSGPLVEEIIAKSRPFSHISGPMQQNFSADQSTAEDAVRCEPFSGPKFPASREF